MFYLRNLRGPASKSGKNRLFRTGHRNYDSELRYFLQFLDKKPVYQVSVGDTWCWHPTGLRAMGFGTKPPHGTVP